MTMVYSVMRMTAKGNWKKCFLQRTETDARIKETKDLTVAEAKMSELQALFKDVRYALMSESIADKVVKSVFSPTVAVSYSYRYIARPQIQR